MQKMMIIAALAILAAALALAGCSQQQAPVPTSQGAPQGVAAGAQAPSGSQAASAPARVRLQDTGYASRAYLISDNVVTPDEHVALSGFHVIQQPQPDGSLNVTLIALQSGYQNQSYVVQPGQQLYFIEGSMGDDSGSQEYALGDDGVVLVDSNGYIVGQ